MSAVGGVPPSRWIVNFDFNLLDGLVLAALLAAYAPFLVRYFSRLICSDVIVVLCDFKTFISNFSDT